MSLVTHLEQLRDRALTDLDAAHDYYSDTKIAWVIVARAIAAGQTFSIRNRATNSVTTQAELAGKYRGYVRGQLAEATFQQFVSIFESYLVDLLRLWLTAYPNSLGGKTVNFRAVLEAADKDAVTAFVVGEELNHVSYKKPADWFAYLNDKVDLGCPSDAEIARIVEAKATRDLLVHNRGIANPTYVGKAGPSARWAIGDRVKILEPYHRETWELFRDVVTAMSAAALAKAV